MTSSTSDHITTQGSSPAFQFYPKDFLGDGDQAGMSLQETGAYVRLMCYEWNAHGEGIPDDAARVANMVHVPVGAMRKMWHAIRSCFIPHPTAQGRLVHPRLQKERDKQQRFSRRQSDASKKRWDKPDASREDAAGYAAAMPKPSSSVFSLQTSVKKKEGGKDEDPGISAVASRLQEIYPEVYAAARAGAVYRTTHKTYERDWPNYYAAAELHPDLIRLRALLEVFLTAPFGDRSSPGTPGQFVNMLPECDERLRRGGWKQATG